MYPLLRALNQASRRLPSNFPGIDLSTPTPTLPIIFISLFVGLGSGVLGFYLAYAILALSTPWSAAIATLSVVGAVSGTAAFLSSLHDRRTIGMNIGFSCALTFLLLTFIGFCLVMGIVAATLMLLV
ncbi:MAG: hypothetical protein KF893_15060 [Caldilineaceae bacterium]|nr:hypothetical protein [Caldilineaceae bacterium]